MSLFKTAKAIFITLRIGGTFPYSFKEIGHGETTEAEGIQFRPFSWVSGWTLLIITARIYFGYDALVANAQILGDSESYGELSSRLNNTYEGLVTVTLLNSICIHSMYQSLVPVLHILLELQLSKQWEEFHILFGNSIGTVRTFQLKKARIFVLVQLTVTCLPVLILMIGNGSSRAIKENETQIYFIASIAYILCRTFFTILFPQLEDIRYFIHCYFIQLYIQEIRNDIQKEIQQAAEVSILKSSPTDNEQRNSDTLLISHRKVQNWHALIAAIHTITSSTGMVMGLSQILSILHELFIITLTAYSTIILLGEVILQGFRYIFLYYGLAVTCFYLWRTFQRCYYSQMIINQECKILRIVESIKDSHLDVHAKQEVRFLIECLQSRPCSVSLSGYIDANNKLLLQTLGTILTYVIVLVQFRDFYRSS